MKHGCHVSAKLRSDPEATASGQVCPVQRKRRLVNLIPNLVQPHPGVLEPYIPTRKS